MANKIRPVKPVHLSLIQSADDRVLDRINLAKFFGSGELRSHWENKVHIVVTRLSSDRPVHKSL